MELEVLKVSLLDYLHRIKNVKPLTHNFFGSMRTPANLLLKTQLGDTHIGVCVSRI